MGELIISNDGSIAGDIYIPEKPTGAEGGKTLFSVPTNSNIQGFIEDIDPSGDIFRGKYFNYIAGPFIGNRVQAIKMVKEGSNYYVIFNNDQKHLVQEVQKLMVEAETLPDDLSEIKPNVYSGNSQEFSKAAKKVPFDPVIEILKKRKKKPVDISLSLSLDLPSKSLYEVLVDDYDDAEIKLIEFLFTPENIASLKESIKFSIREYYGIYPEEKESEEV